jgi:uncharacterized membrane protein
MDENTRIRIRDAGRARSRSMSPQRWGALIGGSALAIYGITRRSPFGVALAASGGTVALLSANHAPAAESCASASILVNCSPQEVYRFWRDIENLPRFMNRLETVSDLGNVRSRWVALGPGGRTIRWDSEITSDRENEHIAWRSLPGSDVQVDGRVEFQQAPAGRGTLIAANIVYSPSLGTGNILARFLNKGASFIMRQDLRRLEALMEAGEIPTIESQSHGPRDITTGLLRVADPTRPIRPQSNMREVFAARRRMA